MRAADVHRLARQLRELALLATENTRADAVTGGELAVLEDLARHPDSTISEITSRVGLAQSLVSRICQRMTAEGVMQARADPSDRRRRRLALEPATMQTARHRGDNPIDDALATLTPNLTTEERDSLETHLDLAAHLLQRGREPM